MAKCEIEVSRRYTLELWEEEFQDLLRFLDDDDAKAEVLNNPRLQRVLGAMLRADESERS
jgi:hypothetical protein